MDYQIQNKKLNVVISSLGAELKSIKKDGTEYLWEGDSKYWDEQSPMLFPFVGRLTEGKYLLNGKEYAMGIHGFARFQDYTVVEQDEARIVFEMVDNAETYSVYPYHFVLRISYELDENQLKVAYLVENRSDTEMYFGIGGHPGFKVPLEEGLAFEDYYLEFSEEARPDRIGFSESCFLNGKNELFALENGKILPLSHTMFDEDAIVLQNVCRQVTLKSDKSSKKVTVAYPDCGYIGFWHRPKTDAPYICIEPWVSLPARQDVVEEFSAKSDLIRLFSGEIYRNSWSIVV